VVTIIARRVASVPSRTPTATWAAICEVLTAPGSSARAELERAAGVAALLIAEEHTAADPIVVSGSGPQVRVYTFHGEGALEADPLDESPMQSKLPDNGWVLSFPASGDDLETVRPSVESLSDHIVVRDVAEEATKTASPGRAAVRTPTIDLDELARS
jgi:hypothetical protein